MKEFNKYLIVILKELCRRVGAKYEKIDFMKENWFREYEWTEDEETDFKKWLLDYLYNNAEARRELTTIRRKNKKHCKSIADWFCFNHGWKYSSNPPSKG